MTDRSAVVEKSKYWQPFEHLRNTGKPDYSTCTGPPRPHPSSASARGAARKNARIRHPMCPYWCCTLRRSSLLYSLEIDLPFFGSYECLHTLSTKKLDFELHIGLFLETWALPMKGRCPFRVYSPRETRERANQAPAINISVSSKAHHLSSACLCIKSEGLNASSNGASLSSALIGFYD